MRKMVSMARSSEEKARSMMPPSISDAPDFPYGLAISLTQDDLDKLDLDSDCEVGDMIDLRAFGRVTSVSKNEVDGQQRCRVEIQIEQLGIEDESLEDEPDETPHMDRRKRYATGE